MRILKNMSVLAACVLIFNTAFSQKETKESFKVSGVCGMCKNTIEKAAKEGGANYASWDMKTGELTVKYSSTSTNSAKIRQAIANSGYDSKGYKATDEAYANLHSCCKYDREPGDENCCKEGVECKDGKCEKCKDVKCEDCKKGKCEKCKEGKCEKCAAAGKDCCKG